MAKAAMGTSTLMWLSGLHVPTRLRLVAFFFVNDRQQIAMSHLCALKVHQLASPFAKLLSYIWFYFRSAVKCTHSLAKVERQKWLSFF